jgi:hypothetical protein
LLKRNTGTEGWRQRLTEQPGLDGSRYRDRARVGDNVNLVQFAALVLEHVGLDARGRAIVRQHAVEVFECRFVAPQQHRAAHAVVVGKALETIHQHFVGGAECSKQLRAHWHMREVQVGELLAHLLKNLSHSVGCATTARRGRRLDLGALGVRVYFRNGGGSRFHRLHLEKVLEVLEQMDRDGVERTIQLVFGIDPRDEGWKGWKGVGGGVIDDDGSGHGA